MVDAGLERQLGAYGEWFHNLHLPGGVQTAPRHPLGDFPAKKWLLLRDCLPADLTGWSVLDVGCNAGFYSFALAERSADVLGIDIDPRYLAQASWAARRLDLEHPPEFRHLSVYRVGELDRPFDLVWFMGVAYHLRHPLLALDIIRDLAPKYLMFQTMTFPDRVGADPPGDLSLEERDRLAEPGWPRMAFVEACIAGDPTNWWVASDACARAMLRSSGFEILQRPGHEIYWCRSAPVHERVKKELSEVREVRLG